MAEGITLQEMDSAEVSKLAMKNEVGTLSNLQTTTKSNLVAAINEAFQSGNERKSQMVAALVAKGVPATMNDSWDSLIGKMDALNKGLNQYIPRWYKNVNDVIDTYNFILGYKNGNPTFNSAGLTLPIEEGGSEGVAVTDRTVNLDNIKYIIFLIDVPYLYGGQNAVSSATVRAGVSEPQYKMSARYTLEANLRYNSVTSDGIQVGSEYFFLDTSSLSGEYHLKLSSSTGSRISILIRLSMIIMLPGD